MHTNQDLFWLLLTTQSGKEEGEKILREWEGLWVCMSEKAKAWASALVATCSHFLRVCGISWGLLPEWDAKNEGQESNPRSMECELRPQRLA